MVVTDNLGQKLSVGDDFGHAFPINDDFGRTFSSATISVDAL